MDLLTEMLSNYKGTLLIVSHDRDFLDQTVNKILYFEGKGKASLFLGGYSDFLNYQTQDKEIKSKKLNQLIQKQNKNEKLSFKFKYELEHMPIETEELGIKIKKIKNELKDNNLYINDPERFEEITTQLSILENDFVKNKMVRELLEMEEAINKQNE